jgi:hypothetical protein
MPERGMRSSSNPPPEVRATFSNCPLPELLTQFTPGSTALEMIDKERLDHNVAIIRAGMKREVAQILDIFASMFRDVGSNATVLRMKRAAPGWQAEQNIAKAEWEKVTGNPRIEWIDPSDRRWQTTADAQSRRQG